MHLRSRVYPYLCAFALMNSATAIAQDSAAATGEQSASQNAAASTTAPARGMSMEKVEAQFGAPVKRVSAVGEPPIARWEYPNFTVYFEHRLVIHAVKTS